MKSIILDRPGGPTCHHKGPQQRDLQPHLAPWCCGDTAAFLSLVNQPLLASNFPSAASSPLRSHRGRKRIDTGRGRPNVTTEAQTGEMRPQAQGCQRPPEAETILPWASTGSAAPRALWFHPGILTLDFRSPKRCEDHFCCYKPPRLC